MEWNIDVVKYWCERYFELRSYELNPFEEIRIFFGTQGVAGSKSSYAPYEETCDLNWEFDKALEKLDNSKREEFTRLYLKGEGTNEKLFKEFCTLLGVK